MKKKAGIAVAVVVVAAGAGVEHSSIQTDDGTHNQTPYRWLR